MNRGEVRFYTFKTPDKRRPVLVLTRNSVISRLSEITIAPITSTIRGIASEVRLSNKDGVPTDCAVNLDHLQTVPKDKLSRLICTLSTEKMEAVKEALLFALGFDQELVF